MIVPDSPVKRGKRPRPHAPESQGNLDVMRSGDERNGRGTEFDYPWNFPSGWVVAGIVHPDDVVTDERDAGVLASLQGSGAIIPKTSREMTRLVSLAAVRAGLAPTETAESI